MPIYEFYCSRCHVIFNFFSRKIDTKSTPLCPRCRKKELSRQVSRFAAVGKAKDDGGSVPDVPVDERKMERALTELAGEAERVNENDPREAARLMRRFSSMTGMEFGKGMQTAIERLEGGEDPERIEAEMGDAIEKEEPFVMPDGRKSGRTAKNRGAPTIDEKLYEM